MSVNDKGLFPWESEAPFDAALSINPPRVVVKSSKILVGPTSTVDGFGLTNETIIMHVLSADTLDTAPFLITTRMLRLHVL